MSRSSYWPDGTPRSSHNAFDWRSGPSRLSVAAQDSQCRTKVFTAWLAAMEVNPTTTPSWPVFMASRSEKRGRLSPPAPRLTDPEQTQTLHGGVYTRAGIKGGDSKIHKGKRHAAAHA